MLEINNTSFEPSIKILLPGLPIARGRSNGAAKPGGGSQLDLWQLIPIKLTGLGFVWTTFLQPCAEVEMLWQTVMC